jgi:hypothetical protein
MKTKKVKSLACIFFLTIVMALLWVALPGFALADMGNIPPAMLKLDPMIQDRSNPHVSTERIALSTHPVAQC